jgi:hypothetical protein
MSMSRHFGKTVATLTAERAAYAAEVAEREAARWRDGREDDSFVSQKVEQHQLMELEAALELAAQGWKVGFVGLCRLDGTPARGRWVRSKWGGDNWMTTSTAGERVFVNGDLTVESRSGSQKAIDKLAALGFRWETRRLYACAEWHYAGQGVAGLWSGSLLVTPCDEQGREVCRDAMVYAASRFFLDGAGLVARGTAEGDAEMAELGWEQLATLNAPRARKAKRAA